MNRFSCGLRLVLAMFFSGIVAGICVGSEVYGDPVYGAVLFSIVGAAELFRVHDLHAERERAGTAEPAS